MSSKSFFIFKLRCLESFLTFRLCNLEVIFDLWIAQYITQFFARCKNHVCLLDWKGCRNDIKRCGKGIKTIKKCKKDVKGM